MGEGQKNFFPVEAARMAVRAAASYLSYLDNVSLALLKTKIVTTVSGALQQASEIIGLIANKLK